MQKVIFACVHNAGRSQMSAAFFNQFADPARAVAISAGTQPAEHVHPVVVEAMLEVGIDLKNAKPQKLTAELAQDAALLITMGSETNVPMCQVYAVTIGHYQIRRIKALIPSDRHGKTFGSGFWDC